MLLVGDVQHLCRLRDEAKQLREVDLDRGLGRDEARRPRSRCHSEMEAVVEPAVRSERVELRQLLDKPFERDEVGVGAALGRELDGRSRHRDAVIHEVRELLDGQAREMAARLPSGLLWERTTHERAATAATAGLEVAGLAEDPQRLAQCHRRDGEPRRQLGFRRQPLPDFDQAKADRFAEPADGLLDDGAVCDRREDDLAGESEAVAPALDVDFHLRRHSSRIRG